MNVFSQMPSWMVAVMVVMAVMSAAFIVLVCALINWYAKINGLGESGNDWIDREKAAKLDERPKKGKYTAIGVTLDNGAFMPLRAHKTDAGLDMHAMNSGIVRAFSHASFETGVHFNIPAGYVGLLTSKSGMMAKGLTSRGTIDSGYTGSVKVVLYNHTSEDYTVSRGDKISQLVLMPVITPQARIVDEMPETDRADGGFGSTGK